MSRLWQWGGAMKVGLQKRDGFFIHHPPQYCTDNAAMITFVGSYKAQQNQFSDLSLNALE